MNNNTANEKWML